MDVTAGPPPSRDAFGADFGMQTTGLPDPDEWHWVTDGAELLRTGLREMYRYWRANEQLVANVMRDATTMPELVAGSACYREHLDRTWGTVMAPWRRIPGPAGTRATAVAGTALDFTTWRSLTAGQGLADADAAEAMTLAVISLADS